MTRVEIIEERARDCADVLAENRYGAPVATGWYAEDVPALVKVARAARDLHTVVEEAESVGMCLPTRAESLTLGAALAELDVVE